MSQQFSYDRVAYPSFVFPQTSPHRLATKGMLYGLTPADPKKGRCLDLGCGDGSNLLLHAFDFPQGEFVGIDLSEPRIAEARGYATELGLKNVSFHHGDVMEFSREKYGQFDYIIAHGLYSWVPDFVREKVRSIFGECLTANGIGYVSYNTYPGCHVREMLWRMMQFHTASIDEPREKIEKALHFLATLRDTTPDPMFQNILKAEIGQIVDRRSGSIFHDDLSEMNKPFYFHEFVSNMNAKGLQYVCDIEPLAASTINMPPSVKALVESSSEDPFVREQYLDFVMWTRFRSSLICRESVPIERNPRPEILDRFLMSSDVKPVSETPNLLDGIEESFSLTYGGNFSVSIGLLKRVLLKLGDIHPRSIPLRELVGSVATGSSDREIKDLPKRLLSLVQTGIVKIHMFQPDFVDSAGEFPVASPFARWQAGRGAESLTSLAGFILTQDNPALVELVNILDGTRDREALCKEMSTRYEVPDEDRKAFEAEMPQMIEQHLGALAKMAFLQS